MLSEFLDNIAYLVSQSKATEIIDLPDSDDIILRSQGSFREVPRRNPLRNHVCLNMESFVASVNAYCDPSGSVWIGWDKLTAEMNERRREFVTMNLIPTCEHMEILRATESGGKDYQPAGLISLFEHKFATMNGGHGIEPALIDSFRTFKLRHTRTRGTQVTPGCEAGVSEFVSEEVADSQLPRRMEIGLRLFQGTDVGEETLVIRLIVDMKEGTINLSLCPRSLEDAKRHTLDEIEEYVRDQVSVDTQIFRGYPGTIHQKGSIER